MSNHGSGQARETTLNCEPLVDGREHKLERLNRTLRAIQHSGQALLRAEDEPAYLARVCQNVVEDCGHMMAWIGHRNQGNPDVRPVAWAGHECEHPDAIFNGAAAWSSNGPTLLAALSGTLQLCRDTQTNACSPSLRALAQTQGYRSILALPLLSAGKSFGVLTVCANEADAFSDQEIALLSELANDLSFGIQTIRLRLAHAQTELALRLSQADLNRAQAVGHIGSWRLDISRDVLTFSTENHRIFGIPEDAPLDYKSFLAAIHPDDRAFFDQKWRAALLGEPFEIEHRLLVDGTVKWVRERAELEFDPTGTLTGGFGTTQDITKSKLLAEALLGSETRFRELVEQTSDGIFVHAAAGRILDVNQAGAEMYGYTREEIVGLAFADLVMPGQRSQLSTAEADCSAGRVVRAEWQARRKDGTSFIAEVAMRRLTDGRSQSLVRDITERRESESERLAALERQRDVLVREVHHRIKNHLQGVIALMRNRIDAMPELARPLGEAINQIDTIAQVYGLQCLTGDARITIEGLVAIAARSSGGTIRVELPSGDSRHQFELNPKEIVPVALVINELITNAIKHSTTGGSANGVLISLSLSEAGASIRIMNGPAALPGNFDFSAGIGLGTGLELVRGLLPRQGALLSFTQDADVVVTDFTLTHPVLLN